jgi:hypothetical protein
MKTQEIIDPNHVILSFSELRGYTVADAIKADKKLVEWLYKYASRASKIERKAMAKALGKRYIAKPHHREDAEIKF